MTKVVHCKKEPFDVYIGRPSKWGNPFSEENREDNIKKYSIWLQAQIESGQISVESLLELRGKTLGCWCHPKHCHGDVLVNVIEALWDKANNAELKYFGDDPVTYQDLKWEKVTVNDAGLLPPRDKKKESAYDE